MVFFFFKQKTAYEMRISDWSSTCALPISPGLLAEIDRIAVLGAQRRQEDEIAGAGVAERPAEVARMHDDETLGELPIGQRIEGEALGLERLAVGQRDVEIEGVEGRDCAHRVGAAIGREGGGGRGCAGG